MLRNILLGVGVMAMLFSVLIFSGRIPIGNKAQSAQGEVLIWGVIPENDINPLIQEFNPKAETYAVRYRYVSENGFNQKLLEALASGVGPDMILTQYQTILSQRERIYPFPVASMGEKAFKDTFVDGASILYTPQGALAVPLSVEPMVLIYNRSMLSKAGFPNPPVYWDELLAMVNLLTIKDGNSFKESAIALGTPQTPYIKDIIMAITMQLGQTPILPFYGQNGTSFEITANDDSVIDPSIKPLSSATRFVSQFGDAGQVAYTWNDALGSAEDRFVAEKLAMYIGYSGDLTTFRERNPRGEFEMTYFPQTRGYNTQATGMRMYALAVLKTSKNPITAFTIASQFSGGGVSPSLAPLINGVTALRAYAAVNGLDPVIGRGMLTARGWYDSHTYETTQLVARMIADVINYRFGVTEAVEMLVSRLNDLYNKI